MLVDIALPEYSNDTSNIYLQGMKGYPNPKCRPDLIDGFAQFRLPLDEFYECGVYLLENKLTVGLNERKPHKSRVNVTILILWQFYCICLGQEGVLPQNYCGIGKGGGKSQR